VITLALKMETARFPQALASTNQRTRQFNPKEHEKKIALLPDQTLLLPFKEKNRSAISL
jgi:hypothetical protein